MWVARGGNCLDVARDVQVSRLDDHLVGRERAELVELPDGASRGVKRWVEER